MKTKTLEMRLDELAKSADTSARTVRYYVQRGLLPPPVFRGKDSAYGEGHLLRLQAIQKMQHAFFPLDAIKSVLDSASDADIARIAAGHVPPPAAHAVGPQHVVRVPRSSHDAPPKKVDSLAPRGVQRMEKIELMPGVELLVSEGADAVARKFVERLIEQAEKENSK